MNTQKDNFYSDKNPLNKGYFAISRGYVLKRVTKLSSAIHLLTSGWQEADRLQSTLRTSAVKILEYSLSLVQTPATEEVRNLLRELMRLDVFLEMVSTAGLSSVSNVEIIKREIEDLRLFTEERFEQLGQGVLLSPQFFTLPKGEEERVKEDEFRSRKSLQSPLLSSTETSIPKGSIGHKNMSYIKNKDTSLISIVEKRQNKVLRREKIIDLVKNKGQATIKDVATFFHDYSEKTIQRELLSLVSKGVLKKEGERRWSKYSLNTA